MKTPVGRWLFAGWLAGVGAGAASGVAPQASGAMEPNAVVVTARPYNPFPAAVATFRSSSNVVQLEVVVRDRDGVAVGGLTQADFRLRDDGEARAISGFSVSDQRPGAGAQPAPVSAVDAVRAPANARPAQQWVAFFVDDVNSTPPFLERTCQALSRWSGAPWPGGEKAAIFTASGHESLDFTDNGTAFQRAAAHIVYDPMVPVFRVQVTFEALRAVVGIVGRLPGERRIIVVGDGFRRVVDESAEQARVIGAAVHAGVAIAALDVAGAGRVAALNARLDSLEEIADKTGGRVLTNSNDFSGGVAALARGPQVAYSLSFVPPKMNADGKFHHLAVAVTRAGSYQVEARDGYYAPDKPGQVSEFDLLQAKIDQEAVGSEAMKQLNVELAVRPGKLADGNSGVNIGAVIHIQGLPFQVNFGTNMEQLSLAAVLTDRAGHYVTGSESNVNLRIRADLRKQYERNGLTNAMALQAPPGIYTLRVVAQESVKGKMSTFTQTVVVPAS